jgi:hypothetical protein
MVRSAIGASQKVQKVVGESFRRADSTKAAAAEVRKELEALQGGIFADMNTSVDMALLLVYARTRALSAGRHLASFDTAAEHLAAPDRIRYYLARATLDTDLLGRAGTGDSAAPWIKRLAHDYYRAAASGADVAEAAAAITQARDRVQVFEPSVDEFTCRLYQHWNRFVVDQAKTLKAQGDLRQACALATRAAQSVPLTVNLKPEKWIKTTDSEMAKQFNNRLVVPLCNALASCADDIRIAACESWWDNRVLAAMMLVRIREPSRKAFALYERAGEDPVLGVDRDIAVAEFVLWKKAGKVAAFKDSYPKRYRLAAGPKRSKR